MTPLELATRAQAYLKQAREHVPEVETRQTLPADLIGTWVSLRANLESAAAELELLRADLEKAAAAPPAAPPAP